MLDGMKTLTDALGPHHSKTQEKNVDAVGIDEEINFRCLRIETSETNTRMKIVRVFPREHLIYQTQGMKMARKVK